MAAMSFSVTWLQKQAAMQIVFVWMFRLLLIT